VLRSDPNLIHGPHLKEIPPLNGEGSSFDARPVAFGPYRVLHEIGAGRLGPVYRAHDETGDRIVAVKVFERVAPANRERLVAALQRLCEVPLDHPSIARPITAGIEGEAVYLAQAHAGGRPLDVQSLAHALPRITQIAAALDVAAAMGIHHGALHPREIVASDETTVVTGIGVAEALTSAGLESPLRTPYASPERLARSTVSRSDDVYALAAITFEALYGRPVTDVSSLETEATPLAGVDHDHLRDVLRDALAEDPGRRPSTALDFAAALRRAIQDEEPIIAAAPLDLEIDPPLHVFDSRPAPDSRPLTPDVRPPFAAALSEPTVSSAGGRWFAVAASLAIGILTGFAGGFFVGQREILPAPRAAASVAARPPRAETSSPNAAAAQPFTEATVPNPESRIPRPESRIPLARRSLGEGGSPESRLPAEASAKAGVTSPESRVANPGRVLVRSTPSGARVLIDGQPRGVTPLAVRDLPLGTHVVEVTYLGYEARQQRLALTTDRPAGSVDFSLREASRPPSTVVPSTSLGAGRPGKPPAVATEVGAGFSRLNTSPETPGALQVQSRPAGAQVFVDEALVGTTPLVLPRVTAGTHAIRLEMRGYQRWATSVHVAAGGRARVAASLEMDYR
jgi:serine/threonine-protein kinase